MSNPLVKQERQRARVCGIRKDRGWFTSHLTTPLHAGAFFARQFSAGCNDSLACGRAIGMVAPAVPRFGYVPEVNLARAFLHRAYDAVKSGHLIEAAVLLREAIRRQLVAECCWYDCLPKNFSDRTSPLALLVAIQRAGQCSDEFTFDMLKEIIWIGDCAARCHHVGKVDEIARCIWFMHSAIDNNPCGEPIERLGHCLLKKEDKATDFGWPEESDWSTNDEWDEPDDPADWWKPEGGAA